VTGQPEAVVEPGRPPVRQDDWVRVLACTCPGQRHNGRTGRADHDQPHPTDGQYPRLRVELADHGGPCDTTAWEPADPALVIPDGLDEAATVADLLDELADEGTRYVGPRLATLPADAPAGEVARDQPWPGYATWRGRHYRLPEPPHEAARRYAVTSASGGDLPLAPASLDAVREYRAHAPTPPTRPLQPTERAAVIRDVASRLSTGPGRVAGTFEYRLRLVGVDEWLRQLADATEAEHPQGLPT
jgi:hypothetical protein